MGENLKKHSSQAAFLPQKHNRKVWLFCPCAKTFHFFHRVFHCFCEKEAQFPTWFSTFSTGFSTIKPCARYTTGNANAHFLEGSGGKDGHFAFYKKESRRFFFYFYSLLRLTFFLLSNLEFQRRKFSTFHALLFFRVENSKKPGFSTQPPNVPFLLIKKLKTVEDCISSTVMLL